jgi:PAS domain S-box-containing protein
MSKRVPHRTPPNIPTAWLAGLFALVLIAFSSTAVYQYYSRKAELEHLLHEEATILIHALTNGAETALLAYDDNQATTSGALADQLRLIERMDRITPLTSADLSDITGKSALYRITVFNRHARRIAWNLPPDHEPLFSACNPAEHLAPILSGKTEQLNLGLRQTASGKPRLVVAIARQRGGAIVGNVDASAIIELRRSLGPGRLIQRFGKKEAGIDYIIWQDRTAIISATPNVTEAEPIEADPALSAAMRSNSPTTRFTTFQGRRVFEVLKPFIYKGHEVGLLRIGLKTDHLEVAGRRLRTRLLMLLGLALTGGVAVASLMASRRNERLADAAWRREQRFSSAVLSNMTDAVLSIDGDDRITLANAGAEAMLRIDATTAVGKRIAEAAPECGLVLAELVSGGVPVTAKELACTIGGRRHTLSCNISPLEAEGDGNRGAIVVLRDVTEQLAMRQLIERQEKLTAMGELASGVAHEIRNPLNAIGMIGQRLDMEFSPAEGSEEYHHLAGAIVSEVHRVDAIIRRFLKFARPPRLAMEKTQIDQWLEHYRPVLEGEANARDARLELHADAGCAVLIDREQLQQALLNIVRNAAEASTPGGIVAVVSRRMDDTALIEVADTGAGIPEKRLPSIFNLYFTSKPEGTGMGLSIANQIVQAHGGAIEVESTPGSGSRFRIVLPVS